MGESPSRFQAEGTGRSRLASCTHPSTQPVSNALPCGLTGFETSEGEDGRWCDHLHESGVVGGEEERWEG